MLPLQTRCSRIIPEEECNLAMVDGELKVDEAQGFQGFSGVLRSSGFLGGRFAHLNRH